jgi:hypothetical protein
MPPSDKQNKPTTVPPEPSENKPSHPSASKQEPDTITSPKKEHVDWGFPLPVSQPAPKTAGAKTVDAVAPACQGDHAPTHSEQECNRHNRVKNHPKDVSHFERKTVLLGWIGVSLAFLSLLAACAAAFYVYKQFGAIQRQIRDADDTAKRQFRAYVSFEQGWVERSKDGKTATAFIQLKNFGQTPAYYITQFANLETLPRIPVPQIQLRQTGEKSIDIGGGQSICITTKSIPVNDAEWFDPHRTVYVTGDIKYLDQFQRCQYEVFQLYTVASKSDRLRLSTAITYSPDPTDHYCINEKAQLPALAKELPSIDPPDSEILGGDCQGLSDTSPKPN